MKVNFAFSTTATPVGRPPSHAAGFTAFLLGAGLLLMSGCTASQKQISVDPSPTVLAAAMTPMATPFEIGPSPSLPLPGGVSAVTPVPQPTLAPGEHLYVRMGFGGYGATQAPVVILNVSTGTREESLPPGIAAPDWSAFYVAVRKDSATTIEAFDPALGPGSPAERQKLIRGDYQLIGGGGLDFGSGGLSPTGKYLVLAGVSPISKPPPTSATEGQATDMSSSILALVVRRVA